MSKSMHPIMTCISGALGLSGVAFGTFSIMRKEEVDPIPVVFTFLGGCIYLVVFFRGIGAI
ncbi:hypothetical protein AD930_11215 [Acetobacter malorum]|nr:hypothetical protein AD930_11215 [Acetobacter malorum]